MGKVFVFAAGIIVGVVSVPVAVVYIRPVQKVMVRGFVSLYTFALEQDGSDFRVKLVEMRDHLDKFLSDNPDDPQYEPLRLVEP
jgi:hypothetical protein